MMSKTKTRASAASEHDDFFDLVLVKLHGASEDGRIMGRLFRLDTGAREGAHLGAILRFVADHVVGNDYDERAILKQLREAIADAVAEQGETIDDVDREPEDEDEDD
jgi:hypothetical protein